MWGYQRQLSAKLMLVYVQHDVSRTKHMAVHGVIYQHTTSCLLGNKVIGPFLSSPREIELYFTTDY